MLHVFDQSEPYPNNFGLKAERPNYFSHSIYRHAASILGWNVHSYAVGYAKHHLISTLRLSLDALRTINKLEAGIAIVWQGYGLYGALAGAAGGHNVPFLLNTYKVPFTGSQALKAKLSDVLLEKALKAAAGVIAISRRQAEALKKYNPNVLWVRFASDIDWWTPNNVNHEYLELNDIRHQDYVLVIGDIHRDEETTLKAASSLQRPILRVTRDPKTAEAARSVVKSLNIQACEILVNVSFELLREIYRGARAVLIPARNDIYPAGMTSMTEAMSCAKPVIIPRGLTTDGYVEDGIDAFVLDNWEYHAVQSRLIKLYESDIGRTISLNARKTAEEKLNFSAGARQVAQFISDIGLARSGAL